jgi:hypothetical protein
MTVTIRHDSGELFLDAKETVSVCVVPAGKTRKSRKRIYEARVYATKPFYDAFGPGSATRYLGKVVIRGFKHAHDIYSIILNDRKKTWAYQGTVMSIKHGIETIISNCGIGTTSFSMVNELPGGVTLNRNFYREV